MNKAEVFVRGMCPKPWATEEWEWRRRVALACRITYPAGLQPQPSTGTRLAVRLVFRMPPGRCSRADLDNLAKPLLDTVFTIRNPQVSDLTLTGALVSLDDDSVYRLVLEKLEVDEPEGEGVDITLEWPFLSLAFDTR